MLPLTPKRCLFAIGLFGADYLWETADIDALKTEFPFHYGHLRLGGNTLL